MSDPPVPPWLVELSPTARRQLGRLPANIAWAAMTFITERLPVAPRRVGKPLDKPYDDLWGARLGSYRVLYDIDADAQRVLVHSIRRRADVYGIR